MKCGKTSAKRILHGIGKAFYLLGKGIYLFFKALAKGISVAYRNYQERKRIEEERRAYYRGREMEGRAYGRGMAQGFADVRERERARRENERYWRELPDRFDRFVWGDYPPKKHKKRR
jgi:hypothetical protein